jgi:putative glutamine amidotransferase
MEQKAPIIGVTPLWDSERNSVWMLPEYLDGIQAAGGVPVVLPIKADESSVQSLVDACDGILFTGGPDVGDCQERDTLEMHIFKSTFKIEKPILGICRGIQFLNYALGGTLWQDLPSEHPEGLNHRQEKPYDVPSHSVILSGSLRELIGKNTIQVNTRHHQAVKLLAPSLTEMAVAPDGIIEALEMPGYPFLQAVQWHPEYLFGTFPEHLAIFRSFINACR